MKERGGAQRRPLRKGVMLLGLIRRDRAFRAIWPWCLMGVVVGVIVFTVARDVAVRRGFPEIPYHDAAFAIAAVAVWFLAMFYLLYGDVTARATRFHLPLPIPVRTLWLSHMLSLLIGLGSILAVAFAFVAGRHGAVGVRPLAGPILPATAFRVLSVLVLAMGLVQLMRPGLREIPMRAATIGPMIAVAVFDAALLVVISRLHPVVAVVPLAAGVALLGYVYRSLPASLSLVPREPESGEASLGHALPAWRDAVRGEGVAPGATETAAARRDVPGGSRAAGARLADVRESPPAGRLLHRTVAGLLMGHWAAWLFVPWALFVGFYLSGAWPDGVSGPLFVGVAWACLNGPFVYGVGRLRAVDHLPISRRLFFGYLMIPGIAVLLAGLALGAFVGRGVFKEDWLWDRFLRIEGRPGRAIPYDFLELAWDGEPPPVTSPWGETYPSWRRPVFGGDGAVVYRPYDTPPGASREFVAYQIGRALRAEYGPEFPAREVERRYIEGAEDCGCTHWAGWYRMVSGYDRSPANRGALLPLMCAVVGVPWLLFVRLALWASHGAVSKARKVFPAIALGSALAVFTIGIVLIGATTNLASSWVLTAFAWIVLRNAALAVPGGPPVLWLLCAAALVGSYFLAESQFRRSEAPLKGKMR